MSKEIEIIGLGSGDIEQLPLGIYRKLKAIDSTVYLRTVNHPVVDVLIDEGIRFTSFDAYYEEDIDFSTVYDRIVQKLLHEAQQKSIIYAVPGHPMLAERTVQLLLKQDDVPIKIIGGQSYLDALFTSLQIDPIDGFQFVDGMSVNRSELSYHQHLLFCQVYDRDSASHVKLMLLEDLPADFEVTIVEAAGTESEKITKLPLEELDRSFDVSNLVTIYVPPVSEELLHHTFPVLRDVIAQLRGPNGCPWDLKQTHESLRKYALEEVYELIEAIENNDDEGIIEELGDVLLQVMLHSQIGEDDGYFTVDDVISSITKKMIYRHPHVFKSSNTTPVEEVNKSWEELKHEEKGEQMTSILDHVPNHLPALQKAYELQKEAEKVGFNWDYVHEMWEKFDEELSELHKAIKQEKLTEIEKELGDVLFILANISRFFKLNPELALNRTNNKFISRFMYVEDRLADHGKTPKDVSLSEMDVFWNEAKRKE